jgi:uncharacterized protein
LIYLDTSTLAPFYWAEANSNQVENLFRQNKELIISELSEVEFGSALSRRVRMQEIAREDAARIFGRFQADLDAELYELVPVSSRHYVMAKHWMKQCNTPLRTLDALHLAIASDLEIPLVTADLGLAKSAEHLQITIQLLQ